MSRNNIYGAKSVTIDIPKFNGINTAIAFSEIDDTESRDILNALPNSLGSLAKRPGTIPITDGPIGAISTLFNLRLANVSNIVATSGNTLYKTVQGNQTDLIPEFNSWTIHAHATAVEDTLTLNAVGADEISTITFSITANKKYRFTKQTGAFQIFFLDASDAIISGITEPTLFTVPGNATKAKVETWNPYGGLFVFTKPILQEAIELVAQTMTNPLVSASIDAAQFRDANGKEVLVICDGGNLKQYDGTTVKDIVAATNDPSPLPANDLAGINGHKPTGCIVHNTRVVLWNGSDTLWHSKIGYYDYYPNVDYQRWVRENDGIQTCVSYRGALMVLMRRHIGVLFGHDRDNWEQDFLDTTDGCLAPATVQTVTYPNGNQEVFYVSDTGVCAIYAIDTLSLDSSARYSTRSVTVKQIDWQGLGVSKEEWKKAVAYFRNGLYWLIYPKGNEWKGLVFDTRFSQWYPVDNIKANTFYSDEDNFYFAGPEGHIKKFDSTLHSDWNDKGKTAGTPINMFWYSKLLTPKVTGVEHFWDILMVEAKQHGVPSTIDIEVNTYRGQWKVEGVLKTEIFAWGLSKWGEAEWNNPNFTDMVNHAKPLRVFLKGQYAQVKISNNRDEPVEIYSLSFEVRPMTRH